jgi:formamidopyrimidine-DNA glycosylase
VSRLSRLGKRIVIGLEPDLFIVIHLMIAGRMRWKTPRAPLPGRSGLAAFDFADGTLLLTEAGTKQRASIHVLQGRWPPTPRAASKCSPRMQPPSGPRCGGRITP